MKTLQPIIGSEILNHIICFEQSKSLLTLLSAWWSFVNSYFDDNEIWIWTINRAKYEKLSVAIPVSWINELLNINKNNGIKWIKNWFSWDLCSYSFFQMWARKNDIFFFTSKILHWYNMKINEWSTENIFSYDLNSWIYWWRLLIVFLYRLHIKMMNERIRHEFFFISSMKLEFCFHQNRSVEKHVICKVFGLHCRVL